jgi:hypothetical protein
MKSELLSLSLTDFKAINTQILDTNAVVKMLLQTQQSQVAGGFGYDNTTNFILGLGLIIIGIMVLTYENNYVDTSANITHLICSNNVCILGVEFNVGNLLYKKEFTVEQDYVRPVSNKEIISYLVSEPSNCYLGSSDYSMYGYGVLGVGSLLFLLWAFFLNSDYEEELPNLQNSLYSTEKIPSGLFIARKN